MTYKIEKTYMENSRIMFNLENGANVYGKASFSVHTIMEDINGKKYMPIISKNNTVEYLMEI